MILLDFILAHAQKDERPYLRVCVMGVSMLGLLDSGATNTILGEKGWELLRPLGLILNVADTSSCTVANGACCNVIGSLELPIAVEGRIKVIKTLVVPSLAHTLILGADFWRKMGVIPDLRAGSWQFSSDTMACGINAVALNSQDQLTPQQSKLLHELIEKSFAEMGDKLGCTSVIEHEIKTSHPPIKQRYYPVSPVMQQHIDKELNQLLEEGVVERSTSPWSSPIVLVRKKDPNKYRFCVDFRKLNQVTERDAYPIPYVSATLDKLRDARYLSSLDIRSAYFQVPLSESSRPLTAFTVPNRGLFQFRRLPMGLANAPATFQRLIDTILGPELEPHVFAYLDDIIVVTQSFEQHLEVLREIFCRLKAANLTVAREKCQFCRSELRYLGYIVNKNGLQVDPEKIQAIIAIPPPKTVSEVRRFLGLASWYRRFVPQFSTVIAPLSNLLRKNRSFEWDDSCENAFRAIKEYLVSAPVLTCPDFSLPFTIQTDASGYGVGAVLTQLHPDGEKVICYLSRSLTRNERNYSTTERECLAVLWAIEKLRPYIEGSKFYVITDHYSLVWLNRLQSPTGRLARWSIKLQQYDYEIIHRKGKENVVPDALSRSVPVVDSLEVQSNGKDKWYDKMFNGVKNNPGKYSSWQIIEQKLFKHVRPRCPALSQPSDYWREVVPKPERIRLISETHSTLCHLGIYKTYNHLAKTYYWPKMRADVANFIRRCSVCRAIKPEQSSPKGLMLSPQASISRPFELLCADLVGPLPRSVSGYQYIFVVADCFSKFPLFFPLRQASASKVVTILENEVFMLFGVPDAIIVDNGPQFKSREFAKLMETYQVHIKYTALYHPQANPCERINKVLKMMLRSFVSDNHRVWDKCLGKIGSAIRSARHEVTGYSPNFLVFGRELHRSNKDSLDIRDAHKPILFDRSSATSQEKTQALQKLFEDVQSRLKAAYERNKTVYDLRRRDEQYFPNMLVWRKNYVLSDASKYFSAKLAPRYVGPYVVSKRLSPWTYELKDSSGKFSGVWHVKDLKSHPPDDSE